MELLLLSLLMSMSFKSTYYYRSNECCLLLPVQAIQREKEKRKASIMREAISSISNFHQKTNFLSLTKAKCYFSPNKHIPESSVLGDRESKQRRTTHFALIFCRLPQPHPLHRFALASSSCPLRTLVQAVSTPPAVKQCARVFVSRVLNFPRYIAEEQSKVPLPPCYLLRLRYSDYLLSSE
jgi:hypothetical protein